MKGRKRKQFWLQWVKVIGVLLLLQLESRSSNWAQISVCDDSIFVEIVTRLDNPDTYSETVRQAQKQIATQFGETAAQCLTKIAADPSLNDDHRINVLWTIDELKTGVQPVLPELVEIGSTGTEPIKLATVQLLLNLASEFEIEAVYPPTVEFLIAAAQPTEATEVRLSALLVFYTIYSRRPEQPALLSDVTQLLIQLMNNPTENHDITFQAINVANKMGKDAAATLDSLVLLFESNPDSSKKAIEIRFEVIAVLGQMGFSARNTLSVFQKSLEDPNPDIRIKAIESLQLIADDLANNADNREQFPTAELRKSVYELREILSLIDKGETEVLQNTSIDRALEDLEQELSRRDLEILKHPLALFVEALTLLVVTSYLLLWLYPMALFTMNQWLQPFTLTIPTPLGEITLSARQLFLTQWFHQHSRVLDAWVNIRIDIARERFAQKATVRDRQIYVRLPVVFDNQTSTDLQPANLRKTFDQKRWRLLIWGEGGIGKTTLACQIAQWGMKPVADDRPSSHIMLPILIEEGLDIADNPAPQILLHAINGQLQWLVDEVNPITPEWLVTLLRKKRLLVIIDHFSEMSQIARQQVQPNAPDFPINALLVTSRLKESLGQQVNTNLMPLGIARDRLSEFISFYLQQQGKSYLFSDDDRQVVRKQLAHLIGQRTLTVLLAKLYLDQAIASQEKILETASPALPVQNLPETIPELVLFYISRLNQHVSDDRLEDSTIFRDIKAISWASVSTTLKPNWLKRQEAVDVLKSIDEYEAAGKRLTYLQQRLNLMKVRGDRIRLSLDPLAEYLSAMYLIDSYGDDQEKWEEFLARADAQTDAPKSIQGLLVALQDCLLTSQEVDKISFPEILCQRFIDFHS